MSEMFYLARALQIRKCYLQSTVAQSVGVRLGIKGLLDQDSLPTESLTVL